MPTFEYHEEETEKEILKLYVYFMLSNARGTGDSKLWKDIARTNGKVTEEQISA